MDFERIGESLAYQRIVRNVIAQANSAADELDEALRVARAEAEAHAAGRTAQIGVLLAALRDSAPGHELLRTTGLVHPSGSPEVAWHRAYDGPYNTVADRHGIARTAPALPLAEARREAVLAEPVTCRRVLFCTTWWFRAAQYRTERAALTARERAAEIAAQT